MIHTIYPPHLIAISSTVDSPPLLQKAEILAAKLNLEFCDKIELCKYHLILCFTERGLELLGRQNNKRSFRSVLFVDFVGGKNGYRLSRNCTIKQPLARAVGIKPGIRPDILDATAGLGGDGFVLASLGCRVTLCERNPVVAALLRDGLERAATARPTSQIVADNIEMVWEDSTDYLENNDKKFQTVYLDPMYPHRGSSALGKGTMRAIRTLVGDDQDSSSIMQTAKKTGVKRIVVKRAKSAPWLTAEEPDIIISMKSSRYDIYFGK